MKKYIFIALLTGFSFSFLIQTARAQGFEKLQTEIPFEFSIGGEVFRAGKYAIYKIKSYSEPQFFRLVDKDDKTLLIFKANPEYKVSAKSKKGVSLVFERFGDDHFLTGINDYSNIFSLQIKQGAIDLAKQKKAGQKKPAPVSVVLPKNS